MQYSETMNEARHAERRTIMQSLRDAEPTQYLSADEALAYAQTAAQSALRDFRSGAADADDMAQEAVTRLFAKRAIRVGSFTVTPGWTKRRIGATVRRLRTEYTAGRTAAQRSAALPLSLDRVNDAETGATLRDMVADRMPAAERTLSASGYGAVPTLLPKRAGTAVIEGGYACRADGARLEVKPLDGSASLFGDDAWAVARAAVARDNARSASGATRSADAQTKHADADAAILAAYADCGTVALAAERLGIGTEAAKSRLRAARRRLAGLTQDRRGGRNRSK